MIRSALRLGVLYLLAWLVSLEWDDANAVFGALVEGALGLAGEESAGAVFAAFLGLSALVHVALCPLWFAWVPLDAAGKRLRHPFPVRPLRVLLRIGPDRFFVAFVLELIGLLLALRTLEAAVEPTSPPVRWIAVTEGEVWAAYLVAHALALAVGWLALWLMARAAAGGAGEWRRFAGYHLARAPVGHMLTRVVAFGVFPLSALAGISHPHPLHGVAVIAWLLGLLLLAVLAQAVTLAVERARDRRAIGPASDGNVPGPPQEPAERWGEPAPVDAPRPTAARGLEPPGAVEAVTSSSPPDMIESPAGAIRAGARRGWRRRYRITAGVALMSAAGLVGFVAWQWNALPGVEETRRLARSVHVHVRKSTDPAGRVEASLLGTRFDYSLNTSLANVSPHFLAAVVASEDHRFHEHGVAYKLAKFAQAGLVCAYRTLTRLRDRGACAGNSTLGQQLARNLFLSEKRSIARKAIELVWAVKMEQGLGKREILELYVNRVFLGKGNFGVEMAARDYFGKSAVDLSAPEAAVLAAAIKRPSWNWHQDRDRALSRARVIHALMRRHGYLADDADFPVAFVPRVGQRRLHRPYLGHLWQWMQGEVTAGLAGRSDGDYKVVTTLDAEVQVYAERRLALEVAGLRRAGLSVTQGAVVVMRPNGAVLAMVGGTGADISARGTNRAKRTEGLHPRPPASAFKPFVYLAALESGLRPGSPIDARPVHIEVPGAREPYRPRNHDGRDYGVISLRDGLVHSVNTAAVRLLHERVGFDRLFDVLVRLGIEPTGLGREWGLALGQSGIPLIEITGAYGTFANGGFAIRPYALEAFTNASGKTVGERRPPRAERVFAARVISDLNTMMRDVVRVGTGREATRGLPADMSVAGKTGTGDGHVDAWFVGYLPDLVIGVWLGNDRPTPMPGLYGGTAPARLFNAVLRDLVHHTRGVSIGEALP